MIHYAGNAIIAGLGKTKYYSKFNGLMIKILNLYTLFLKIRNLLLSIFITIAKIRYPLVYKIFIVLHFECVKILTGDLQSKHIFMFLFLGFYIDNVDYSY
jgi:hypothetical protein